MVRIAGLEGDSPRLDPGWLVASCVVSLSLSFSICKMGMLGVLTSQVFERQIALMDGVSLAWNSTLAKCSLNGSGDSGDPDLLGRRVCSLVDPYRFVQCLVHRSSINIC